jgi:hypothetical protein
LEKKRKGIFFHIIPYISLSYNHLEGVRMKKGGEVVVKRFSLVYLFFIASLFYLSPGYLIRDEAKKGGTEPLYFSEEFVEKFSEVFFRDN